MPRCVSENGQHNRQADQQRHGSEQQAKGDDQTPERHWHWVLNGGADRCSDGCCSAHIAIDQHRERHDADDEHERCEQEADDVADDDELRALLGCRQLIDELAGDRASLPNSCV